jgi:hypothetical protein
MGFYGSFGNIQIARNLGVVASLKEEIDDLLLPVPHSADLLFHELHLTGGARHAARAQGSIAGPSRTQEILVLSSP